MSPSSSEPKIEVIPQRDTFVDVVAYSPNFTVLSCGVSEEPYNGRIMVEYSPQGTLLEFMSFDRWLAHITKTPMTVEEFASLVFRGLTEALGPVPLSLMVEATTNVHAPVVCQITRPAAGQGGKWKRWE